MKKEVLLSLLMTTPVAFPALAANISLPDYSKPELGGSQGWNTVTTSGLVIPTITDDKNGISCPAGISGLTRTYSDLPVGTYLFNFEGLTKGCVILVNGNKDYTIKLPGSDEPVAGFHITDEKKTVTITINAPVKDNKSLAFGFTKMNLELVFDFDKAVKDLEASLKEVKITNVNDSENGLASDNPSQEAVRLRGEYQTLMTKYNGIEAKIKAFYKEVEVEGEKVKVVEGTIKLYRDNKLYASKNTIQEAIEELLPLVTKYNEDLKKENDRRDNEVLNTNNLKTLQSGQQALLSGITTLVNDLQAEADKEGATQLIKDYLKEAKAIQTEVATFATTIEEAYSDLNKDLSAKYTELTNATSELQNKIDLLKVKVDPSSMADDYDAYTKFAAEQKADPTFLNLRKALSQWQQSVDAVKGLGDYPTVFADWQKEVKAEMKAMFDEVSKLVSVKVVDGVEVVNLATISGAADTKGEDNATVLGKAETTKAAILAALDGVPAGENPPTPAKLSIKQTAQKFIYAAGLQNEAFKKAITNEDSEYNKAVTKANSHDAVVLPSDKSFKNGFDAAKNAVNVEISNMKEAVVKAYGKKVGGLTDSSYSMTEVNKKQADFDNWVNTTHAAAIAAATGYKGVEDQIKNADIEIEYLKNLFNDKLTTVKGKLDALTTSSKAAEIKTVQDEITAISGEVTPYITAFTNASCVKDVNSYKSFVQNREVLEGATDYKQQYLGYMTPKNEKSWETIADEYEKAIADAVEKNRENPTNVYLAVNEIGGRDEIVELKQDIAAKRAAFNRAVAEANYTVANTALTNLSNLCDNISDFLIEGETAPALTDATTDLATVAGKIGTKNGKTGLYAANLSAEDGEKIGAEVYTDLNKLVNTTIPALEESFDTSKANYEAYTSLKEALDKFEGTEGLFELVKNTNATVSKNEAKQHYTDKIQEHTDSFNEYKTDFGKLVKKDTKLAEACSTLASKVSTLDTDLRNLNSAIIANNTENDRQRVDAEAVSDKIDDLEKYLTRGSFTAWADELAAIKSALQAVNAKIVEANKNGESVKQKDVIAAELTNIETVLIKNLYDKYRNQFASAMDDHNKGLLATPEFGWNTAKDALDAAYKAASERQVKYQDHENVITNDAYYAEVLRALRGVEGGADAINKYYSQKSKLASEVDTYLSQQLKGEESTEIDVNKFTKTSDPKGYTVRANEMKTNITAAEKTMKDAVDQAGKDYYNDNYSAAETTRDNNLKLFSKEVSGKLVPNKGIFDFTLNLKNSKFEGKQFEKLLEAAGNKAITDIDALVAELNKTNPAKEWGYEANKVANWLDNVKALSTEDLEDAAREMWKNYYGNANEQLAAWETEMASFVADPSKTTDLQGYKDAFAAAYNIIKAANTRVSAMTSGLFGNALINAEAIIDKTIIPDGHTLPAEQETEALTIKYNQFAAAKTAYTAAKTLNDANTTNNTVYTTLDTSMKSVEADYKEVVDFAAGLAAPKESLMTQTVDVTNLRNEIETEYKNCELTNAAAYDSKFEKFTTNYWAKAYRDVLNDGEVSAINKQIIQVKAAITEASTRPEFTPADIDAYNDAIAAFETTFNENYPKKISDAYAIDNDEEAIAALKLVAADLLKDEKTLSDLYEEIRGKWDPNGTPVTQLRSALDTRNAEVVKLLEEAVAYYNACEPEVKTANPDAFNGISEALAKVKSDYDAADNTLLMQKQNYYDRMDDISASISKQLNVLKKVQDPINDSRANFAKVTEAKNALQTSLNTLKETIENAKYYKYGAEIKKDDKTGDEYNVVEKEYADYIAAVQTAITDLMDDEQEALDEVVENILAAKNPATVTKYTNTAFAPTVTVEGSTTPVAASARIKKINEDFLDKELTQVKVAQGDAFTKANKAVKEELNLIEDERARLVADLATIAADAVKIAEEDESKITTNGVKDYDKVKAVSDKYAAIVDRYEALIADAQANTFVYGDVDCNKVVNVVDAQQLIDIIGNETQDELSKTAFAGADVSKDGVINVADVAGVINIAKKFGIKDEGKDNNNTQQPNQAPSRAIEGANFISAQLVGEEGGVRRYAVNITNCVAFVAGQLDIKLDPSVTLVNVVAADRAENHNVALFHRDSDNKRVILSNMDNAVIGGENGAVIYVEVLGEGNVSIENAIFADSNCNSYRLAKPEGTSGIEDTVIDNNGGLKQRIYNAAGQMLRGLQRGVNIIRNADGSVSKEYHK